MNEKFVEEILSGIDDRYIAEAISPCRPRSISGRKLLKRTLLAAACVGLLFALSVTALAAAAAVGSIPAYDILYAMFPETAEKLTPVNLSCVEQGFEFTVSAVYVHENTVDVYTSIRDLEGGRLDEYTSPLYEITDITGDMTGSGSLVEYDEETGTVTWMNTFQVQEEKDVTGEKLTLQMFDLMTGRDTSNMDLSSLDLSRIPTPERIQAAKDLHITGYSAEGLGAENDALAEEMRYLVPNEDQRFSPVDGVEITAWGFVDGQLHIQAHYANMENRDNDGFISLRSETGAFKDCTCKVTFTDGDDGDKYVEYIFDLNPAADFSSWTAAGEFFTWGHYTGSWRVTFPIENMTAN